MAIERTPPHFLDRAQFAQIAATLSALAAVEASTPTLGALAAQVKSTPQQLGRLFAAWAGVALTDFMHVFAQLHRDQHVSAEQRLLAAAHAMQLTGAGRLGRRIVEVYEAPAGTARAALDLVWGVSPTPMGLALLVESARGILRVEIFDDERSSMGRLQSSFRIASLRRDDRRAQALAVQIFGDERDRGSAGALSLHMQGSEFDHRVWRALVAKDCADLLSYGQLAKLLGEPRAARAVGSAVGRNRLGWIIPCHHILRADGGLGGYHWGVDRKRALLVWESLTP